ncbi:MAG: hypothetical protein JW779_01325 [Candidatus Thorarchaeota archaeon]|nr:hypothetical protein [Candidatus Thorarchaeota archaeon]
MSYNSGRGIGVCLSITFGIMTIVFGLMFVFLFSTIDTFFQSISWYVFWAGIVLVIVGVVLIPSARNEARTRRKILEIAAVRKEVTISEISAETGIDSEYIRNLITTLLINGMLFGYLEGDLFVRDTSARPRYYGGQAGLFGALG